MSLRISSVRIALVVLLGPFVGVPVAAARECIKIPPEQVTTSADMVLSGKVVELTNVGEAPAFFSLERPFAVRVTFDVDRVWFGRVSKQFELYMIFPASSNAPYYEKGNSYVVIPKWLGDKHSRAAAGFGDSDAAVFTGANCSGIYSVEDFIRALGPGKPPTEKSDRQIDP